MKKWGLIFLGTWFLTGIVIASFGEDEVPDIVAAILAPILLITMIIFIVKAIGAFIHRHDKPQTKKTKPVKAAKPKKIIVQKQQQPTIAVQTQPQEYHPVAVLITLIIIACLFIFSPSKKESEKQTPQKQPVEQKEESKPVQKTEEAPDFVQNGKLVWNIPVCTTAEDYSEYLHAYVQKDADTMKIYERKYRCWILKTGVRVSILDWHLIKPTKIRVYSDGDMFDLYTSAQFVKGAE